MNPLLEAIFLSLIAGAAIPLGGVVASIERIQPAWLENEFRHTVISFGGGALFAAVALVLIPEGIKTLSILSVSISFISGAMVFLAIDYVIAQRGGTISQVIAMLLDFIPEAMALGAVFSKDASKGLLISFLIGIQNLPEGFNAYREIIANRYCSGRTAIIIFTGLAFLGPVSAFYRNYIPDGE